MQRALLTPMYQNECFPSELESSASSTKKSSIQMPKYFHWPKRELCRPQQAEFNFIKVQTNWINQTARGNALI